MSTALLSLKIVTTLLGLTLPGYALARLLRLQKAHFAAFPLSALIICQSVTAVTIFNGRITFPAIAAMLVAITLICGLPALMRRSAEAPIDGPEEANPWCKPALTAITLLLLAAAFRVTLYPLGGFDTFTRWDALAREMLKYGTLSFYPPVTGADFSMYTLPDGFPPLVASVYWWIYAATGTTLPQLTAISVILQLASILGLTWYAAEIAFGKKAASLALLALTASPLLIHSVLIGQESGFLSLAVAGQICFALAAIRRPSMRMVTAAALFASIGALSREYGPALALPGFFLLIFEPVTRRLAWRYALTAALISCPWYIRNWVIAGSPLYPTPLPGFPHPNQLLDALMDYYSDIFGLSRHGINEWFKVGCALLAGGGIALLAAVPYLAITGRRLLPHALSLAVISLLWLWSVGKTSGGIIYSMRVLSPAMVILAIVAGGALKELPKSGWKKYVPWLLIPASLWGVLSALAFPLQPGQISSALLSTKGEAPEFCEANREFAKKIDSLDTPATGVLTDSPYLAVILKRETRFRPVIIWSSEVSFLFDSQNGKVARQKLIDLDIRLVALDRSSVHNGFLFRMPFFRDDFSSWTQLPVSEGDLSLFELPSGNSQRNKL